MSRGARSFIGCLSSLAIVGLGLGVAAHPIRAEVPNAVGDVIINEVYGGGGNAGATYTHDFIELYNSTGAPIDLSTYSVQYRSAAGAANSWVRTDLTGTIPANGHHLVQQAQGNGGTTPLPAPDSTGTTPMAGAGGVVALVSNQITLDCTGSACVALAAVRDLVGSNTANTFAGAGPTVASSNTTSVSRDATHANTWNNAADFTAGPPTPTNSGIAPPMATPRTIAEIQGTGSSSPHVGELVVTEGVVTASYPTGGFNGFVIQTEGTGGLATLAGHTASDAIFVFGAALGAGLTTGDHVEVTGTVQENFALTRLTIAGASAVTELADPFDPVAPVTAPWPASAAERESIESMLLTPQGDFTVSETFPTNQFGEVGLATGTTPLRQPSDVAQPGTAEFDAVVTDNFARGVTLDDGASTNYLSAANSALTPPFITTDGTFRVGAPAALATDVIVDFQFGAWRFQPLGPVTDTTDDSFVTFSGVRPAAPDPVALGTGDIKVATFNVLNYFTTGGVAYETSHPGVDCTSFNDRSGAPITVRACSQPGASVNGPRGAWDATNLARQQAKTVSAINALDADVVGLMEIENSANLGEPVDEATATLVGALNAAAGATVWAFIPSSAEFPDQAQRDVITVAIIYKPAAVSPLGASRALGNESAAGGAFDNAREPLGQAFEPVSGGDPFFVVVNHFKSKGCDTSLPPTDPNSDQGDGQSCFNADRIEQADALDAWVESLLPTYTAPPLTDVFLLGDFNAYTQEDPMQVFYTAGYTDLNEHHGNVHQSYNFDGLNGSLDHILANESALDRVTGSDIWNINAPESLALEYSRYNYHGTLFYAPDAYRSSDHDPEVAAITSGGTPPPDEPRSLTPLVPRRILDTRVGGSTVDDLFEGIGIVPAGSFLELQVAGRGGIPEDAVGAVLNITATDATGVGYVTVYPCGEVRPVASSLNFDTSSAAPNTVITAIGDDGDVCLYVAESAVHLIADANGFVDPSGGYAPLNPSRLADSRAGASTIDGQFLGGGPRGVGSVWEIQVTGRGGVPSDAQTAALNVTTTGASGTGYVTIWPCDAPQPLASSVNFVPERNVPNAVVSKLSAAGTVCMFVAQASTHLVVDVNGAFLPGSDYNALVPARLLDTRNAPTLDGQFSNGGIRQPGQVLELVVAGRGAVPGDAVGVVLNVTSDGATGTGYVTAWPCGGTPPNVSSLNFVAGTPRANAAFLALSPTGTICLVVQEAPTHLIVDVVGAL